MSIIFGLEIALALLALIVIINFFVRRAANRGNNEPIFLEPDLKLVDQPELISELQQLSRTPKNSWSNACFLKSTEWAYEAGIPARSIQFNIIEFVPTVLTTIFL